MSDCCTLITNRTFCKYVKGIDLDNATPAVELANLYMCECVGEECFDSMCADGLTEVTQNKFFKILYARLIEYYWLMDCGDGRNEAAGFVQKLSDEMSDFKVISTKDLHTKLCNKKTLIDSIEESFKTWFKAQEFSCSNNNNCGCENECNSCNKCNTCSTQCGCSQACQTHILDDMATI